MKKLNELFDCNYDTEIKGIKINSKEIEPGDLFVCTKGVNTDRHDFIEDAIKNGASAIVVSRDVDFDIPTIKVEDTNKILPIICSKFYDHPEEKLIIIGVTGTDGKTSTATIIQTLLGNDICGYIGTNGRSCSKFNKEINNTTPDSDKLFEYFYDFVNAGCKSVAMEASSEAFFRHRLDTIKFNGGIITNITREHLNIHKTFENYIECKSTLFKQVVKDGFSVLNIDDPFYERILSSSHGKILTYGYDKDATFRVLDSKIYSYKTGITFKYLDKTYNIESPLLGQFNVYNLMGAIACCVALGFDIDKIKGNIKYIKVSGRLDIIPNMGQDFTVMIDYAHTPNGITNLLNFVHTLDINRSIVVIGSAGERDYLKRPIMGKCVTDNASYAIFTYEDPRSEDPKDIIDMLTSDIRDRDNYEVVIDRKSAIEKAINMAQKGDMVLILGKGNETYQKLKTGTIYFNDIEEATNALKKRLEKEKVNN